MAWCGLSSRHSCTLSAARRRGARTPWHRMMPGSILQHGGFMPHHYHNNADGLGALLMDLSSSIESVDWSMLLLGIGLSFSITLTILTGTLWMVSHSPQFWSWACCFCCLSTLAMLVYVIEPRPLHWLPSLRSVCDAASGLCSRPSEIKMRIRRWWRWRNKYAQRTKLNV